MDVNKGVPTMDLGEHDLQVNGDIIIADLDGDNGASVKGMLGRVLWKNNSPTSVFQGQQITLRDNDYDVLEWYFLSQQNDLVWVAKTIKGCGSQVEYFSTGAWDRHWTRRFNYNSDTKYTINDCVRWNVNTSVTDNSQLILAYVIGYKTDIFN